MLTRLLKPPHDSFFLFGPRGTGKTTSLRHAFPDALWFDLLNQQEIYNIMRSPGYFAEVVEAQPKDRWVVVDEVQKAPQLLDEIHRLIETRSTRFVLSGSSARKLRRGGVNLLAGRALVYHLFPFTIEEIGTRASLNTMLEFGSLPKILLEETDEMRVERLRAYVSTYLTEEIKAEALSRNLESFSRFLAVAALANGQVTNLSNIARDSGTSRSTVTSYFQILQDTLIGFFLPAWQPRLRVKEVNHPKFYFFDCGVFRALADRLGNRPTPEEKGVLLETWVFHEVRSANEYKRLGGNLFYWRTHDGVEVDFIWRKGNRTIAIEAKSSDHWKPDFGKGLLAFKESRREKTECLGVYLGPHRLRQKFGLVYPLKEFARLLYSDRFL